MKYRGYTIITDGKENYRAYKKRIKQHKILWFELCTSRTIWVNEMRCVYTDEYSGSEYEIVDFKSLDETIKAIDFIIDGWKEVAAVVQR